MARRSEESCVAAIHDCNGAEVLMLVGAGLHGVVVEAKQGGSLKKFTSQILTVESEFSVKGGMRELNITPIVLPLIFSKLR